MTNHDHDNPFSELAKVEMAAASATISRCAHCTEERRLLPMGGTAWGIEHIHEAHCPEHEDNQ